MTDRDTHAPSGALRLPRDTTPTWEIELLISGATVFGLLQLPAALDTGMVWLINRIADDVGGLLLPLWIYLQTALVILIGTFIVHLCLRAYWVALVGLHSVYPGGVRWESFKHIGPYQLETSRRGRDDIAVQIEQADNRASRVFGVGVGLAMGLLLPTVLVALAIGFVLLARSVAGSGRLSPMFGFWLLFGCTLIPWLLAMQLDQRFGARWTPERRAGRWLRAVLGFYTRLGLGRASNLPMALYTSNAQGQRRSTVLVVALGIVMVVVGASQVLSYALHWEVGDQYGLPRFAPRSEDLLLPRHYASQSARQPSIAPLPYIPDPVVRGPYLRLFVPYRVSRHNAALARHCEPADEGQRPTRAALDCYARLHDVRIDGELVAGLRFDAAEDPVNGLRGLLAMIPVRDLAHGRHELSLLPLSQGGSAAEDEPPRPYRIPFWR